MSPGLAKIFSPSGARGDGLMPRLLAATGCRLSVLSLRLRIMARQTELAGLFLCPLTVAEDDFFQRGVFAVGIS
jgi:hypothetical protein